jgi:glycosyltransferase involved in cell wall biosynthesis
VKIIVIGDAVAQTGFSRCTHAVADSLHSAGHEILVIGINYYGSGHTYPYRIIPAHDPTDFGHDGWGIGRLPSVLLREFPDIVIINQDPWNIKAYFVQLSAAFSELMRSGKLSREEFRKLLSIRFVGWLAVDAENQITALDLNDRLDHVVVWTEFAKKELETRGWEGLTSIIPLGVNTSVFYPREGSRSQVFPMLPEGAFIIGVVGRNQVRKRIDLSIRYFAKWLDTLPATERELCYLYLHVAPTGEQAVDIRALISYYGLKGRVMLFEPQPGHGVTDEEMAYVYSALDVLLSTTQGEGFGLTTLEAMACGTVNVVPGWSGLGCWTKDAAIKVPCTSVAMNAPQNQSPYTIGGIPDEEATTEALNWAYDARDRRCTDRCRNYLEQEMNSVVVAARQLADKLSWRSVHCAWADLISLPALASPSVPAYIRAADWGLAEDIESLYETEEGEGKESEGNPEGDERKLEGGNQ